mmetsp:Transcript_14088/g.16333  ORF Transcript_14088/g.16333 Transcript_14088/m.16333 type:complete len:135 (+) Transcript_14088:6-410(+)
MSIPKFGRYANRLVNVHEVLRMRNNPSDIIAAYSPMRLIGKDAVKQTRKKRKSTFSFSPAPSIVNKSRLPLADRKDERSTEKRFDGKSSSKQLVSPYREQNTNKAHVPFRPNPNVNRLSSKQDIIAKHNGIDCK